jgi:hypothetical protein
VPSYHIYELSRDNRIVGSPDEIVFASDHDAVRHAKGMLDGLDIEVWEGARRVVCLKSTEDYRDFILN